MPVIDPPMRNNGVNPPGAGVVSGVDSG